MIVVREILNVSNAGPFRKPLRANRSEPAFF
jgi:hypothetical protein